MNQPKIAGKTLLILADSITGDIVLNNKLFNTRSIFWSILWFVRDQSADPAIQTMIQIDN